MHLLLFCITFQLKWKWPPQALNHGLGQFPLNFGETIFKPTNEIFNHGFGAPNYVVLYHGLEHFPQYFNELILKPTNAIVIMVLVLLIVSNHGFDHLPLNFNETIHEPKNAIGDPSFPTFDYFVLDHGLNHFLLDFGETYKS